MKSAPRVVLETDVVVSALVFAQGRLAPLRLAWQVGRCRPLVSRPTADELIRALASPGLGLAEEEQRELLADYLPYCAVVGIASAAPRRPAWRDPIDVPFLQLAVAGKADCLVSGGGNLLGVAGRIRCAVLTPDQFMETLAPASG